MEPPDLHMITPLKHMSPFDVNMALDAGFDAAIPYTNVTVEDVPVSCRMRSSRAAPRA